ncbi:MAG TPA: UDP-3-O-acyl-N-acetylglucosamine deacetylase, partial [Candidatus Binataceae bacterium]|nr:UDP-3-O-acyl-N-acetylglucosamine deacetylase [Candidatus Binataceae bacterium]
MDNTTVLVVDDEERIRSSLCGILTDEGFRVLETDGGPSVMDIIEREHPELVLLDVWMPKLDGIELLRRIKAEQPATRVIMISGHANIQNAVTATRLGAADFIEKPFSVDGLLTSIERVLAGETGGTASPARVDTAVFANGRTLRNVSPTPPQFTVKSSLVMAGQGLHSGLKSGIILQPAPPGTGIVFSSLADQSAMAARLENVTETGYNTTLSSGGYTIRTVEHLMSALHGL